MTAPRVGIIGIHGRMGQLLVQEIPAAGAVLAGGVDRQTAAPGDVPMFDGVAALARAADVVIDFTHASAVKENAVALAEAGTPWVLGTTGLGAEEEAAIALAARSIAIVQAANFSPGVNLLLVLAEQIAASLPAEQYDAEILELHHRQKRDAPSGTALALGHAIAKGRGVSFDEHIVSGRHGDSGPRKVGEIGLAALRGGQIVGEHEVMFLAASEQICVSHRAFDRRVFATGAVQAALWVLSRPVGRYSMCDVLRRDRSPTS